MAGEVPFMDKPDLSDVLRYINKFPCSGTAYRILQNEVEKGNEIEVVSDVGGLPDETVVIVKFKHKANANYQQQYPELKDTSAMFKGGISALSCCDNNGAMEIIFLNE